jgi:hypothetical protein
MPISSHLIHFAGKPVVNWPPASKVHDPSQVAYRVRMSYEEADEGQRWTVKFADFVQEPEAQQSSALVVGIWDYDFVGGAAAARVVEALVTARDRLPNLRAIFLGDITYEECEISWIVQTDVSPLLNAYPALENLSIRGGEGLQLGALRHERLKTLVVESGGLGAGVVREVAAAHLPALEHLELWLGDPNYGATATVEDLAPILAGDRFPRLRYLGLRDSKIADEVAIAVAQAPLLERIQVLDLSLGTLSDKGAAALLASPAVARLQKLDIHHHFCSSEMVDKLKGLGIAVNAGELQAEEEYDGETWRYVAVGE